MTLLSADRRYRFSLTRKVPPVYVGDRANFGGSRCLFVMLNPSTADERIDDPTIRRCIGFAEMWGYSWLDVANLFPFRAPDPRSMMAQLPDPFPISRQNDETVIGLAERATLVVAAWGNRGALLRRGDRMMSSLAKVGSVYCLGMTKVGQPKHPLYVPRATEPMRIDNVPEPESTP